MKRFFKKHKILCGILLLVVVTVALVVGYVLAKLSKLEYSDGKLHPQDVWTEVSDGDLSSQDVSGSDAADAFISDEEAAELGEAEVIFSQKEIISDKNVVNILLLGTDERGAKFSSNARADSIMILSLNKKQNTIKLVSLQRGMGVPVLEGTHEGQYDWITHMFRYGGADLMLKTVREMFHIEVDYFVRVNFNTFAQLVDSVGGVDITLTEIEAAALNGEVRTNAWAKHKMYTGVNHLDGYDALQYSRLRYTDSDWKRVQRQRNVIQSVVSASGDLNLLEINALLDEVLPLIQTNMTSMDIVGLVGYAPAVLGKEFEQMTIPVNGTYGSMKGMGGRNLYAVDFQANSEILHEFLYGIAE